MTAPQAFRLGHNRLHIGHPTGRAYQAACGRTVACTEGDDDLVVYVGRQVGRAWNLEVICLDCDRKVQAAFRRRQGRGRRLGRKAPTL